jgi:hypothetical protein
MSIEARTTPRAKQKTNGLIVEALKERVKKPVTTVETGTPLPKAEPPKEVHIEVDDPIFLMNIPYSYSTAIANNAWMGSSTTRSESSISTRR